MADIDTLALEFASDALSPVGGMGRVDLHDPCGQLLVVDSAFIAAAFALAHPW